MYHHEPGFERERVWPRRPSHGHGQRLHKFCRHIHLWIGSSTTTSSASATETATEVSPHLPVDGWMRHTASSTRGTYSLVGGSTPKDWSGRVDLNHRPPGPEPVTKSTWTRLDKFSQPKSWKQVSQ